MLASASMIALLFCAGCCAGGPGAAGAADGARPGGGTAAPSWGWPGTPLWFTPREASKLGGGLPTGVVDLTVDGTKN